MDRKNDYTPAPMDTSKVRFPNELNDLIDDLAQNAHEVWAEGRMAEGKSFGKSNDTVKGKNTFLKPYDAMNPAEKLYDINSVEQTIKFILKNGYKIENIDKSYWDGIERQYFKKYHSDKAVPIYKAPLIIGLVSDTCADTDVREIHKSIDEFAAYITKHLGIPCEKCENSKRETPVYIISELANNIEHCASEYAFKNYGFEIITINNPQSGYKNISIPCPAVDYITSKNFMLLSFWKGLDKHSRAGTAVRKTLLEYDRTSPDPQRTVIGDSHAVYHVVLPGDAPTSFYWKNRLLLPYILESGDNWYTLRDAQIIYDRDSRQKIIMGQTAATLANGSIKEIVRKEKRTLKQQYKADRKALDAQYNSISDKKLIAESANRVLSKKEKATIIRLLKKDKKNYIDAKKKLREKYSKDLIAAGNKEKYNKALEKSKKERHELNLSMFGYINRSIKKGSTRKPSDEFDLLTDDTHGKSLCADVSNLRHLRLDTIATTFQNAKKKQTTSVAFLAAIGLAAYGIFSDLASARSLLGIIGGTVSALTIIAALVIFIISQHKNYHSVHLNLRLLSEMLRVKTYLNAAGIYDSDVADMLSERQQLELEWAKYICRGWDIIDTAEGYYEPSAQKPISLDVIRRKWIGSADNLLDGHSNAKVYNPSSDKAQMDYDRGRGSEYFKKARNLSIFKSFASVFAVVTTLGVTITAAIMFFINSGLTVPESWQALFNDQFDMSARYNFWEALFVFLAGIIPAVIGCFLIFHESQMYSENALRYKWMAVKYQKLTACIDSTLAASDSDEAVRKIFKDAARAAVEEIGEWTLLTAGNEAALPF